MSFLERLRAPGARALRRAGPPEWQVLLAFVVGGLADIAVGVATDWAVAWPVYFLIPGLLCLLVSIADRDGWTTRMAVAYVGLEQRRRFPAGLPVTPEAADRWLADAANAGAGPLERVSALMTAGRLAEAGETLAAYTPANALDAVRLLRLRAAVAAAADGRPEAGVDVAAVELAARDLPEEERRYQVVSAAWTQAWLDLSHRRPWRSRFVRTARAYGPYPIPSRVQVVLGIQQLAAPIAFLIVALLVALVVR